MSRSMSPLATIRRRFSLAGPESLSDQELVALLVGAGPGGNRPLGMAEEMLQEAGGLKGLARRGVAQLTGLAGLGPARACALKAALELGKRATAPRPPVGESISSAADVAEWFRHTLQDNERECIHALFLDGRHRPLHHMRMAEGSWTSCTVDPKVLFSACLRHAAPALILVHNHPSGDPTPSRDDIRLTDRLVSAGRVVGIKVLDHLIVGRYGYVSLADRGMI